MTSKDIVANTISVIDEQKVKYLQEWLLSNLDAVEHIVGLPIETLNSLQQLAEAINSDATCSVLLGMQLIQNQI